MNSLVVLFASVVLGIGLAKAYPVNLKASNLPERKSLVKPKEVPNVRSNNP